MGESPTEFNNDPGNLPAVEDMAVKVALQRIMTMNSDEIGNLVRQGLTLALGSVAGSTMTSNQSVAIAAGAGALASVLWSVYAHWNMKKVPETK